MVIFSRCDHKTSPFRLEYKERSRVLFNRLQGFGIFCVNYSVWLGDHASFIEPWGCIGIFP